MFNHLLQLDISAYRWCNRFQNSFSVIRINFLISKSGDGYCYALLASALYLFETNVGKSFLLFGLFAYLLEIPSFIILKKLIKRDRPFVGLSNTSASLTPADKFSLPSGHSAAAFVMATIISYFYPNYAALAYVWATLIGFSRVMLGVHYPTDIIAGALLGICCSSISILTFG